MLCMGYILSEKLMLALQVADRKPIVAAQRLWVQITSKGEFPIVGDPYGKGGGAA